MTTLMTRALAAAVLMLGAQAALAHPTLERREAQSGASYKGVMRIGHGCGKSPTIGIRITIPEGVYGVKPMPKAGWTLTTTRGAYGKTYKTMHGEASEGIREISWSGGKLPDDWYDEFVFVGQLAGDLEAGKTLYFPVVQVCEGSETRWTDIPSEGQPKSATPAAGLKLLAPAHSHHQH